MHRLWTIAAATLSLLCGGESAAAAADPFASDWAASSKSRARLVADGAGGAGIEIELAPGAVTYWREPGEAGVPPVFDFAGSRNVEGVEVQFPAPARIPEPDGSTANGYRERVIFPLRLTLADPGKTTVLKLNANYAVCEKICLPARASLSLELPKGLSGPYGAALAEARDRTPKPAAFEALGGTIVKLDGANWRLCFAPFEGGSRDLFLEPPQGAWIDAKPSPSGDGRACYALSLRAPPLEPNAPLLVTATLASDKSAQETAFTLPKP